MRLLLSGCSSLKSLPDISKWDTNNVTNMSLLFSECSSLQSLPDISKWNIKNIVNINNIFISYIIRIPFRNIWE